MMNPARTGLTLAVTLAISYTVCALAYAAAPAAGIVFLNDLFHGLDFGRLVTDQPFSLATFIVPLLVFVLWGFLVGALFAFVHNRVNK